MDSAPLPVIIALTKAGWEVQADGLWTKEGSGPQPWAVALQHAVSDKAVRVKKATETTEFWMTVAGTAGSAGAVVAAMSDAGQGLGQPWAGLVVAVGQFTTIALPVVYSLIRAKAKALEAQGK
jgi:hypothetical protein